MPAVPPRVGGRCGQALRDGEQEQGREGQEGGRMAHGWSASGA